MKLQYSSFVLILSYLIPLVWGHGYMIIPASRNTCWRKFPGKCPASFDDNGLNCGGRNVQISLGGKCGVCGDKYGESIHVYPGKYAKGFITKTYKQGQEITVKIHITANHKGWFEFRVGEIGSPPITQKKLTYLLKSPQNKTRYLLGAASGPSDEYVKLMLPPGLTCDHCVLQWWWNVGNSWGCDARGCAVGNGDQENFVNCADIKITRNGGVVPNNTAPPGTTNTLHQTVTTQSQPQTTPIKTTHTNTPPQKTTTKPPPKITTRPGGCKATGIWRGQAAIDQWCVINCAVGFCPSSMCTCTK